MAFWTYILRCADGKYYTGHTEDLERRMAEHSQGGFCGFTSRRRPVALVWCEEFPSRYEALSCEIQVGKWSRAKKEPLIARDWERVSFYARPPHERVSTSLDTNGNKSPETSDSTTTPFASSEVEKPVADSAVAATLLDTPVRRCNGAPLCP